MAPKRRVSKSTPKTVTKRRRITKRNAARAKKIGQVWVEKRGTLQGKPVFHVYVRTASNQDVDMYDSPNQSQANWEAKTLRQKLAKKTYDVAWITKRENADHRDADHPIEVTKHWRQGPPGYLTPWQRAHHAGQGDLFAHGITPAKLRNSKRRNPDLEQQAIENRIEFAGHYSGPVGVFAAAGTPDGLSRLGQLAELELSTGAKLFFQDKTKYFLAQDTKHRLHIVSAKPGAQVDNTPGDYGEIKTVEYLERKTHLGDDNNEVIQWVHQLGEISGKRPLLRVDKNGQLRIVGGDYSINWRGIIN